MQIALSNTIKLDRYCTRVVTVCIYMCHCMGLHVSLCVPKCAPCVATCVTVCGYMCHCVCLHVSPCACLPLSFSHCNRFFSALDRKRAGLSTGGFLVTMATAGACDSGGGATVEAGWLQERSQQNKHATDTKQHRYAQNIKVMISNKW